MSQILKLTLLIGGLILFIYGVYQLITPEVSVDAGPLQISAQDNSSQAWAMLIVGAIAVLAAVIVYRKK